MSTGNYRSLAPENLLKINGFGWIILEAISAFLGLRVHNDSLMNGGLIFSLF
jgi:hypothetical protein